MRVLITGDRSLNPLLAVSLAMQQILSLLVEKDLRPSELQVVVGLNRGVEFGVRMALETLGLKPATDLDWQTTDWATYAEAMKGLNLDQVFFVHTQPEASRLYQPFSGLFEDDEFTLVNPTVVAAPVE